MEQHRVLRTWAVKRFDAFDAALFAAVVFGVLALDVVVFVGSEWIAASVWRAVMS